MQALKCLIRLQREPNIVIKQCDKGAGIMILDFKDYINACLEHLQAKQTNKEGIEHPYYKKVKENKKIEEAKAEIQQLIDEGYDNDILT